MRDRRVIYPNTIVKLPTFEDWFLGAIAQSLATCEEIA
jgi:hypothetical protein